MDSSSDDEFSPEDVAKKIDHTLLKADASEDELRKLCEEAKKHHFFSVCVNSANVRFVAKELTGSSVKTCAVVGFPLGAGTSSAKAYETKEAIKAGADEIDMVMNIGALKSKNYRTVLEDIQEVVSSAGETPVKVILETGMLNQEEKIIACSLSKAGGAAFVKTSTGFGPKGATVEDIVLMRSVVGPNIGVKASGGIRTWDDAVSMLGAGANRLGCSASVAIVTRKEPSQKGY
ncbi:MAG: deoxyribose-phosphate aldolase [Deltaproteobacteria bacterium RIFCSPHIGHO2_12_FULL_43_9]|nr:MAG: deoxyribose-phosphate aldolase [Deltaproteobacteria bacterium RIFCSPHIGHO2_12_FULL_43_9]